MRIFIFVLVLIFTNLVYAQVPFVYDEHGKRDPFVPLVSSAGMLVTYDKDLALNDMVLEGILTDPTGSNAAIVNGKVVKVQDPIGPYTVSLIGLDHVEFTKGTEKFVLGLKKGGT